jgi:hypothetical protein
MLEITIEQKVCDRVLHELGVLSAKLTTPGQTGYPDRIFWLPNGRLFLIEFKRPGEKARKKQLYVHQLLRKLGYQVEVHDDADRAFEAVRAALATALVSKKVH